MGRRHVLTGAPRRRQQLRPGEGSAGANRSKICDQLV